LTDPTVVRELNGNLLTLWKMADARTR